MDHSIPAPRTSVVSRQGEKKVLMPSAHASLVAGAGGLIRLSTAWLFQSAKEIEIEHRGDVYRLRQTALGKLILTK